MHGCRNTFSVFFFILLEKHQKLIQCLYIIICSSAQALHQIKTMAVGAEQALTDASNIADCQDATSNYAVGIIIEKHSGVQIFPGNMK